MREGPSMSEFRSFFPHRWADVMVGNLERREEYDRMLYDWMYEDYERERDILLERELAIRKNLPEPEIRSGLLTVDTNEMKKLFAK